MSIKIHHGPPGSYKTSGALGDDFLREAKAGRVIVTNVRGVSRERCFEVFPDLPDSFDVIHVDTKTIEGRKKLGRFFHWVPHGAFIFVDEAQSIFPKSWRASDLEALDYPGGHEAAAADDRPANWADAWDMHRHYNWDIVLTTPKINKIREDIRGASEGAYKHKNLGILGFGGRYVEGFHMADDDGGNSSQFLSITPKKVPKYVWQLYESTATGNISDTKAGRPMWREPKMLALLVVLAVSIGFVGTHAGDVYRTFTGGNRPVASAAGPAHASGQVRKVAAAVPVPAPVAGVAGGVDNGEFGAVRPGVVDPADDVLNVSSMHVVGTMRKGADVLYYLTDGAIRINSRDLERSRYVVVPVSDCVVRVTRAAFHAYIGCGKKSQPSPIVPSRSGDVLRVK